jgi:hypothetical protein
MSSALSAEALASETAAFAAWTRASSRSRWVATSASVGSFAGNWSSEVPTTASNVVSPDVTLMSTDVPWILPTSSNV